MYDDDDDYDRQRDAWLTGDSNRPVTRRQRQAWNDERDQYRQDRRDWGRWA